MKLDPHIKDTSIEIVEEERQEYKMIGGARRPFKNAKLFATDGENVYEIKIRKKEAIHMQTAKTEAAFQADINPKHTMIWAVNKKNAIRKFKMYLK